MHLTYTSKDLSDIAGQLLDTIPSKIWLFYGEMGSGKTTLIKALAKQLGVIDVTSSPTFSLVNEYASASGKTIYHFDFYRIKNENEALDIGIEDYFYDNSYCFIEWPDKIENLLPLNAVAIYITVNSDNTRSINFKIQ